MYHVTPNSLLASGNKCEVKLVVPGVYRLESTHRSEPHQVHTSVPSCTCRNFRRTKFPCRHIFQLVDEDHIRWEDLPAKYRAIPFFNIDTGMISKHMPNCS